MLNKIYNWFKRFIRENFSYLLFYIISVFVILYPINYYIITGGGTFEADKRVSIKNAYNSKGSLSFCYVKEIKGTIFTYLLSYVVPSFERESADNYKINKKENLEEINLRNTMMLNETNNSAIYVAYTKAGKTLNIKETHNYVYYITDKAKTDLLVGDEIISIDDNEIKNFDDLKNYVSSKNVSDKLKIEVIRNDKKYERYAYIYKEKGNLYIGVSLMEDVKYETTPKIKFKFKSTESGPSGGAILSLQIYNMLTKSDITKGKKIAGTGTIDKDGNVGEIDGVKYKLSGAVKSKNEVFLVPDGRNYKEAMKEVKKHNYNIKVINIKSFDDALEKLSKLK